jgi:hypothetical protein
MYIVYVYGDHVECAYAAANMDIARCHVQVIIDRFMAYLHSKSNCVHVAQEKDISGDGKWIVSAQFKDVHGGWLYNTATVRTETYRVEISELCMDYYYISAQPALIAPSARTPIMKYNEVLRELRTVLPKFRVD